MNTEDENLNAAKAMVKAIFDDQEAEINGRVYKFTKLTHKQRRKVFSFFTSIAQQVSNRDFTFMDSERFEPIELIINKSVTYDGSLLSVLGDDHWEKFPADYVPFMTVALQVITFPFTDASATS